MLSKVHLAIIFLGAILATCSGQAAVGCYSQGECLLANYIDIDYDAREPVECHERCLRTENCTYWTFYDENSDDYACFSFSNCPSFSENCAGCTSGEASCDLQLECDISGRCLGPELGFFFDVPLEDECAELCVCNPFCEYFTHDTVQQTCVLTASCDEIDTSCSSCNSGQSGCDTFECYRCEAGSSPTTATYSTSTQSTPAVSTEVFNPTCYDDPSDIVYVELNSVCYIESDNYPNEYYSSTCDWWVITAPNNGENILLRFLDIDIECGFDEISIYDGNTLLQRDIDSCYSGSLEFRAQSGEMTVVFTSDSSVQYRGFLARVSIG